MRSAPSRRSRLPGAIDAQTAECSHVEEAHADRIVDLYRRHAHAWVAARRRETSDPPFEASWLERFLGLLPARPNVLDLGCGSGEPIGRFLAERGCDLLGVDTAPEMIDMWRASLPDHPGRVGDMRSLSLHRTFDGVLAWDSFFHLCHGDQRRMFPVFRAHATRGAVLLFTSGTGHGTAIGELGGEALYHASLDEGEYRALLGEHGFEVVAQIVEDPACRGHTIWLARLAR